MLCSLKVARRVKVVDGVRGTALVGVAIGVLAKGEIRPGRGCLCGRAKVCRLCVQEVDLVYGRARDGARQNDEEEQQNTTGEKEEGDEAEKRTWRRLG